MLAAHAQVAQEQGRFDDAARDLLTMLRIEDHLQRDPTMIALLVAGAVQTKANAQLANLLSAGDPNPDLLRQLATQLEVVRSRDSAALAMRGERAMNVQLSRPCARTSFPRRRSVPAVTKIRPSARASSWPSIPTWAGRCSTWMSWPPSARGTVISRAWNSPTKSGWRKAKWSAKR